MGGVTLHDPGLWMTDAGHAPFGHPGRMSWGEVARGQGGAITRRQLRAAGLSDDQVDHLIASRALEPVTAGVLLVRGAPYGYHARLWTAVLATRGVIGFRTAGHLWGTEDTEAEAIDVIVEPRRRVTVPFGVRVHRVFVPHAEVVQLDGLPVTNRSWTLLDQLGRLPAPQAQRLADRTLQRGWLQPEQITRRLRDYPCRTGNRQLRLIAARCTDGAAAESERRLHRLLRTAGVREWEANLPVWHGGELIAVVDVAVRAARLAIEVDGWAYHSDVDRFQRDRQRQNALVALGWTVLRFTWADLVHRPSYVVATIRGQLARAS